MFSLSKLAGLITGTSGFFGIGTLILGIIVALAAAASWMREDALNDCNTQWELKLAKANQELHNKIGEKNLKITALEKKLLEVDAALAAAVDLNRRALEKQRETVPLSDACTACRVPNERLWLRRPAKIGVEGGVEGGGRSASSAGSEAPAKEAELPRPREAILHGPRAGIGAGLSR